MITATCSASEIIGRIRVQPLGPYLVRIEQEGPNGFENRETFTVINREIDPAEYEVVQTEGKTIISTTHYRVAVPDNAKSIEGIRIESPQGKLIKKLTAKPLKRSYMPSPSKLPKSWIMTDNPRVVPPEWGALPPPQDLGHPHSGWDLTNNAPDIYVFLPQASGYEKFRADFIALTGPVPLVPLYAFGIWYSRYHPYSEETALEVIDTFRKKNIPLDIFVADTDWRVGASCGYGVNTNLFPDMKRFIDRAHAKNVRLMYNDHPEPKGKHAMAPDELQFRHDGLRSLLDIGADVWWFDRNWYTHLQSPAEGLNKEVWGMRLYRDVTQAARPSQRPLIMSNVDGIDNGHLKYPSHPAAHRFPIWWTGDTRAQWNYLKLGVQNGVDCGIHSLLPYVNEDLSGHHDQPNDELYTRFMQFGALSPITRIHSTANTYRYPWKYSAETEEIVGDYFRLRYRLLPTIYSAAYETHRSGMPILRRCDLEWPQYPEAADNTQYLFGDDLLVAPILTTAEMDHTAQRNVWIPPGEWEDVWTGKTHSGPATITVTSHLEQTPIFVRRGGIITTIPQQQFTDNTWTNIILDAYVPGADSEFVRHLYEDDGMSTAYTNSIFGLTRQTLKRNGSTISLNVEPSNKFNHFPVDKRDWSIRFHLPEHEGIKSITLDGKKLDEGEYKVIDASQKIPKRIFEGAGSPPPPQSGSIVELPIRDWASTAPLRIEVRL